jgi:hypothetical protein
VINSTEETLRELDTTLARFSHPFLFAKREAVSTTSGGWSGFYLGFQHAYVEFLRAFGPSSPHLNSIALRSTSTGGLEAADTVLRQKGYPVTVETEYLSDGREKMEWFHSLRFADSENPVPFFLTEYAQEYLDDIASASVSSGATDHGNPEPGRLSNVALEVTGSTMETLNRLLDCLEGAARVGSASGLQVAIGDATLSLMEGPTTRLRSITFSCEPQRPFTFQLASGIGFVSHGNTVTVAMPDGQAFQT